MSDDVIKLLDTFDEDVRDDVAAASETLQEIEAYYAEVLVEEDRRATRALESRDGDAVEIEDEGALTEYIAHSSTIGLARSAFLMAALAYVTDPTSVSRDEVLETTAELRNRESDADRAYEAVETDLSNVELPGTLSLVEIDFSKEIHPKGRTHRATVTLSNVGDEPVEDVSVRASAGEGVDVDPERAEVGTIDGGETESIEFDVGLHEAGDYALSIRVLEADADVLRDVHRFEVDDRREIIETIQNGIDDLKTRIEESSLGRGGRKTLQSTVDAAEKHVDRAAETSRERPSNDRLRTASNQLGAFLNKLDASGEGNGRGSFTALSSDERIVLERAGEALIDLLSIARETDY